MGTQKKKKMVNPRDIAGNTEEEEDGEPQRHIVNPRDLAGNIEEDGEPQRYSWGTQKNKKKMVNPRGIAGERRRKGW